MHHNLPKYSKRSAIPYGFGLSPFWPKIPDILSATWQKSWKSANPDSRIKCSIYGEAKWCCERKVEKVFSIH